jgi:hypothetical protein
MGIIIGGNTMTGNFSSSGDTQNAPNIVTNGLVLWLDAGNIQSWAGTGYYYDCGYGCQYYSSSPGCTSCNNKWLDLSGYGNDGTIQNSAPVLYNSSGGAFVYSSSNQGVTIANSSSLTNLKTSQGGSGLTVLVWAKSNSGSTGAWRKLIGNGDGDNYIDLYQSPGGYWHQDGSGETLFVDGVGVANDSYYMPGAGWHQWGATNLNSGTLTNPAQVLTIGNEYNLSSYPWTIGEIAIVQIYNRVLSTDEMLQNFNNQRQRFGV